MRYSCNLRMFITHDDRRDDPSKTNPCPDQLTVVLRRATVNNPNRMTPCSNVITVESCARRLPLLGTRRDQFPHLPAELLPLARPKRPRAAPPPITSSQQAHFKPQRANTRSGSPHFAENARKVTPGSIRRPLRPRVRQRNSRLLRATNGHPVPRQPRNRKRRADHGQDRQVDKGYGTGGCRGRKRSWLRK